MNVAGIDAHSTYLVVAIVSKQGNRLVSPRRVAEQTYKRDEVDAELLARMRVAGLIPEVYAKTIEPRDQAVLVRHRATLVRERTSTANRIHGRIQAVGLRLARGRLLTEAGRSSVWGGPQGG